MQSFFPIEVLTLSFILFPRWILPLEFGRSFPIAWLAIRDVATTGRSQRAGGSIRLAGPISTPWCSPQPLSTTGVLVLLTFIQPVVCGWCPDPPENCHLTVKKLPKAWHFFQKNCQKFSFFSMAIFLKKMSSFWQIFWQSNGNFPEGQVWTFLWLGRWTRDRVEAVRIRASILSWNLPQA